MLVFLREAIYSHFISFIVCSYITITKKIAPFNVTTIKAITATERGKIQKTHKHQIYTHLEMFTLIPFRGVYCSQQGL